MVQPQTWLWAHWDDTLTSTGLLLHLQRRVPPEKLSAAGVMPLSTEGCIVMLMNAPRFAVGWFIALYQVSNRAERRSALNTTLLAEQVKYDLCIAGRRLARGFRFPFRVAGLSEQA
jgi:hypothetical protein